MKLKKTLLAALLAGITLQTVESCTKEKDDPPKNEKTDKEKEDEKKPPYGDPCFACGMG
jgi:hypothetical protein